jgi:hypothetical protein
MPILSMLSQFRSTTLSYLPPQGKHRFRVQAHSSLPSRAEIISTNDEDEIFGHIVAMKLQKMPERMKSIAKMRVLETLIEVQYGKQALQNGTADID